MVKARNNLSHCGEQVFKHDNDRFLVTLFAPGDRREALFALGAFNLEVAMIREVVREPMLGRIRLQWWREAIAACFGERALPAHAVTGPLARAIQAHGLARAPFERLLDAREADLDEEAPPTQEALTTYAEATAGSLASLGLGVLGVADRESAEAVRLVAIAYALSGLLRAVPFHARHRRVTLPADQLAEIRLGEHDVPHVKDGAVLKPVVRQVAALAGDHLARARALRPAVARAALPALLPARLADLALGALARADWDVLAPKVARPHPWRAAALTWAAVSGRY